MDQELELIELSGTVDSVIYKNEENGYTVLRLTDGNGETVTVVGCFPYASAGEGMIISGNWVVHGVHGRQFKAEFAQRLMPSGINAIYDYLAGGAVKGIGPATASLIVNKFGEKTLDILENSPEKLAEIRGISLAKAEQISETFRRQSGMRRLMEFICSFGLRPILAIRMYKFYGDDALELLRENPYILVCAHIGGSFAEADTLAMQIGFDGYNKNRINAAVIFELVHNSGNGHCFIPKQKLAAVTSELIGVDEENALDSIEQLIENGQLMYEEIAGCEACYLPDLYYAECGAADKLASMAGSHFEEDLDVEKLISSLEKRLGIKYAPLQRKTIQLALENQVLVVTGGPGTGKTTTIRAIIELYDKIGLKTLLTAPTGRAAKRMSELSGRDATTVHRLLGAKFSDDGESVVFTKDESDPLECDAVILDECSMVDITLMNALLSAMPENSRLVMVGDADQLPSVGPGNVFSAIIRSGVIPSIVLTEIFRQNEGSRIIRNSHMINKGEYPNLAENAGDFFRLKRLEAASSVETICDLFAVRLPNKMNIPIIDIQVLSPTRKGEMGTFNLNRNLQQVLNPRSPQKNEKQFGEIVFREGDRVMQIKNNYDIIWRNDIEHSNGTGIYNGDIGYIRTIDNETETMTVDFDGRIAVYEFELLLELEHAWAMTVHKSQGSEYKAVILSLSSSSQMLLTRDVLYTAVTRAKELLVMVGDEQTAYRMIDNYRQTKRYSALRVRLRKLCGAV